MAEPDSWIMDVLTINFMGCRLVYYKSGILSISVSCTQLTRQVLQSNLENILVRNRLGVSNIHIELVRKQASQNIKQPAKRPLVITNIIMISSN